MTPLLNYQDTSKKPFDQKIREKVKAKEDAVLAAQQPQVNKANQVLRSWEKLNEEYSDLTLKVYGERRKGYFTSIEQTLLKIEELKQILETR